MTPAEIAQAVERLERLCDLLRDEHVRRHLVLTDQDAAHLGVALACLRDYTTREDKAQDVRAIRAGAFAAAHRAVQTVLLENLDREEAKRLLLLVGAAIRLTQEAPLDGGPDGEIT